MTLKLQVLKLIYQTYQEMSASHCHGARLGPFIRLVEYTWIQCGVAQRGGELGSFNKVKTTCANIHCLDMSIGIVLCGRKADCIITALGLCM